MYDLVIPGTDGAPSLNVHVNPTYVLYHYLAKEALRPREERAGLVREALGVVRETLAPEWSAMARRQGELLGVAWPEKIDAFLVTDCYDWHGGYSHPLTLDIPHHDGIAICESILHEATHVADVHTSALGQECLGNRLMERIEASGVGHQDAWNAWHAVIFAASGRQVRESVSPDYADYAEPRGLYSYFKVPGIAPLWDAFASGAIEEDAFTAAVSDMLVNPGDGYSKG